MSKISRNDRCPCGSGKKYKRCCQEKDRPKFEPQINLIDQIGSREMMTAAGWVYEEDRLDRDSNRVAALIREGRLDEAEAAGMQLLKDYPEVQDGFERLAMVYEARGDSTRALERYQQALDFVLKNEELFDQEMPIYYRNKIAKFKDMITG